MNARWSAVMKRFQRTADVLQAIESDRLPDARVRLAANEGIEPEAHAIAVRFSDRDLHLADRQPAMNRLDLPDHFVRPETDAIEIGRREQEQRDRPDAVLACIAHETQHVLSPIEIAVIEYCFGMRRESVEPRQVVGMRCNAVGE